MASSTCLIKLGEMTELKCIFLIWSKAWPCLLLESTKFFRQHRSAWRKDLQTYTKRFASNLWSLLQKPEKFKLCCPTKGRTLFWAELGKIPSKPGLSVSLMLMELNTYEPWSERKNFRKGLLHLHAFDQSLSLLYLGTCYSQSTPQGSRGAGWFQSVQSNNES